MFSINQSSTGKRWLGIFLGLIGALVYLITLDPDVSFWDCGEFIATSYGLEIGHPPGAPLYSLMCHIMLMLGEWLNGLLGLKLSLAWWSNALSALAGGWTVAMLYYTILLIGDMRESGQGKYSCWYATIGALCYLFCDSAWFSAVESEVYSLSMAFSSTILWAMLKWYHRPNGRWLLLIALLLGMSVCVHMLSLLTTPALLLIYVLKCVRLHKEQAIGRWGWLPPMKVVAVMLLMFVIGLSPYLIVPIRAKANPPINEGNPSTVERFHKYIAREQYEHAPLWPRMWRKHKNDALYNQHWSSSFGELEFLTTYQMGYMWLRYLLWNYSGRYNDYQGYGSLQNGQFITGIPPIDKKLVGTSAKVPDSLPNSAHNVYLMLPLLLGILGATTLYNRNRKGFWVVVTLFITSGPLLVLYLNTPAYEPRERDYAYILSIYAYALMIGGGSWLEFKREKVSRIVNNSILLLGIVAVGLMACQNWDDHNRSKRFIAYDAGMNILNSCDEGAILFTLGDNDTFPLWYLQQVAHERTDIRVENINLMGTRSFLKLLEENDFQRPVYFSHYAQQRWEEWLGDNLQLEGNAYRLMEEPVDKIDVEASYNKIMNRLKWRPMTNIAIDEIGQRFVEQYWKDVLGVADTLAKMGDSSRALNVVNKTLKEAPIDVIQNPLVIIEILKYREDLKPMYKERLLREINYYHTLSPQMQRYIPYQLQPREEAWEQLK